MHRPAHFKAVNLETRSGQCTLQFSPTDGPDWLMSPRCKHRHAALTDSFSHSIFQPFDSAAAAAAGTDRGFALTFLCLVTHCCSRSTCRRCLVWSMIAAAVFPTRSTLTTITLLAPLMSLSRSSFFDSSKSISTRNARFGLSKKHAEPTEDATFVTVTPTRFPSLGDKLPVTL